MKFFTFLSVMFAMLASISVVHAEQQALTNFNSNYATNVTDCSLCHLASIPGLNQFGSDFKNTPVNGSKANSYNANFGSLDALDSDNNLILNGAQIAAGNSPADVNITLDSISTPISQDLATVGGCVANQLSTPLMMLLAMLSLGFMVKRKKA